MPARETRHHRSGPKQAAQLGTGNSGRSASLQPSSLHISTAGLRDLRRRFVARAARNALFSAPMLVPTRMSGAWPPAGQLGGEDVEHPGLVGAAGATAREHQGDRLARGSGSGSAGHRCREAIAAGGRSRGLLGPPFGEQLAVPLAARPEGDPLESVGAGLECADDGG